MDYKCTHCFKEVLKAKGAVGKYCSNQCQKLHESDIKIKSWIEFNTPIGKAIARRYLKETYGNKCSVCSLDNWLNKEINLEIDHTDGNAYNNVPSNLRLICPNCHSQTSTYKNRNKGNGRKLRKSEGWLLS